MVLSVSPDGEIRMRNQATSVSRDDVGEKGRIIGQRTMTRNSEVAQGINPRESITRTVQGLARLP